MTQAHKFAKLDRTLVAILLVGLVYLGLVLFLGTSTPFLLVRGTSMQPTLHAGDLLIGRSVPPTEIKVGDIIFFRVSAEARQKLKMPPTVAHRVLSIEGSKGEMAFVTKGDRSDVDAFKVPASAVRGVVVKNLGPVGRPILFLTSGRTLLFFGLPALAFIVITLAMLWLGPGEKAEKPAAGPVAAGTAQPAEIEQSLHRLASAVADYGVHLQSHTAVVKNLAASSEGLEQAVRRQNYTSDEFRQVVQQQVQVLADLAVVAKELKEQMVGTVGSGLRAHEPARDANGYSKKGWQRLWGDSRHHAPRREVVGRTPSGALASSDDFLERLP